MTLNIKSIKKKITIVVPIYNESEALPLFFTSLIKTINLINDYTFEILIIDDGSTDDSLNYLKERIKEDVRIVVYELSRNFGKEAALTAGLDLAKGDAVIPIDVDLQDPPDLIELMIRKWEGKYDVVLAKRINRNQDSFFKKLSANFFYFLLNLLTNNNSYFNVGDYRLMDRAVVESVKNLKEKNRFMKGLLSWPGFKVAEIEYVRGRRVAGKSKFNFFKLFFLALEGITSFSTVPLKIFTLIGFAGLIFSSAFSIIIVIQKFFLGQLVEGYAFLSMIMLFFGSLQLLGIGILGEYIGKIYLETKGRPIYIVKNSFTQEH